MDTNRQEGNGVRGGLSIRPRAALYRFGSRWGGVRAALVVCLALIGLVGLATLLWEPAPGDGNGGVAASPGTQESTEREPPSVTLDLGGSRSEPGLQGEVLLEGLLPRTGPPPESDPLALFDEQRFAGVGTLRVTVRTAPGVEFPAQWTLVLEPSDVLIGGVHATGRRVPVSGTQELVLDDVVLGGYSVHAEAASMNCDPNLVLLALPNEADRRVFLELVPAGYLTGRVVDGSGADVDGVPMVLEPFEGGVRRTTHTDPAGVFLFENVLDGEYRLFAGVPESPIAPARDLAFRAPSLNMPVLELPALGEIDILVLDVGDLPVAGLQVTGYGKQGGRIDVTTDDRGQATARFLPEGWFTLLAQHGDGERTRARAEVHAGEACEVVIRLHR